MTRRLLLAALLLALAGCGGGEDATTEGDSDAADSDGADQMEVTDSDWREEGPERRCWGEGDRQICPEPPRGTSPEDCADGVLVATEHFQGNTGICLPFDPDNPDGPVSPSAPRLTDWDCPEGWLSVPAFRDEHGNAADPPAGLSAFNVCDVPSPPEDCPPGTFAIPGDTTCRPLGVACPASGELWHSEEIIRSRAPGYDGPILYVSATGSVGGAGTRSDPMADIDGALAALEPGGIVALARGSYEQTPAIESRAALVGACVAGTTVVANGPSSQGDGVITLRPTAEASLSDLMVTGARVGITVINPAHRHEARSVAVLEATALGILVSGGTGRLDLRDVRIGAVRPDLDGMLGMALRVEAGAATRMERGLIEENLEAAVWATGEGTRVELGDVTIRGTRERATDGYFGVALHVSEGAEVWVERMLAEDNRQMAVTAKDEGTHVELRDLVIRGTRERRADERSGGGIHVDEGAHVRLERGVLEDNRFQAVSAWNEGTRAELRDVVMRGTREQRADGMRGQALVVWGGAVVEVDRGLLEDNRGAAVHAGSTGTRVEFRDFVIRGTRQQRFGVEGSHFGRALNIQGGATALVDRGLLEDNRDVAVGASSEGTRVELRDLVVRNTREPEADGIFGVALFVAERAEARVERGLLEDNRGAAVLAATEGTRVELRDVVIRGTRERETDREFGRAFVVVNGAAALMERALLEDNRDMAVVVADVGTHAELRDLVVRGTRERSADGRYGGAISIEVGAKAIMERALLDDNRFKAVFAVGLGTRVELRDVVVQNTAAQSEDGQFGIGAGAYLGARPSLTNTVLTRNAMAGLQVAREGSIRGDGVALVENAIGINIQVDNFDLPAMLRNLVLKNNAEDVMYLNLPVPDPSGLLGELPEL